MSVSNNVLDIGIPVQTNFRWAVAGIFPGQSKGIFILNTGEQRPVQVLGLTGKPLQKWKTKRAARRATLFIQYANPRFLFGGVEFQADVDVGIDIGLGVAHEAEAIVAAVEGDESGCGEAAVAHGDHGGEADVVCFALDGELAVDDVGGGSDVVSCKSFGEAFGHGFAAAFVLAAAGDLDGSIGMCGRVEEVFAGEVTDQLAFAFVRRLVQNSDGSEVDGGRTTVDAGLGNHEAATAECERAVVSAFCLGAHPHDLGAFRVNVVGLCRCGLVVGVFDRILLVGRFALFITSDEETQHQGEHEELESFHCEFLFFRSNRNVIPRIGQMANFKVTIDFMRHKAKSSAQSTAAIRMATCAVR